MKYRPKIQHNVKIFLFSEMYLKTCLLEVEIFIFLPFKMSFCKIEFLSNSLTIKMRHTAFRYFLLAKFANHFDVASDVGFNFKNVGVLSIESSLFYLFHYTSYKLNIKEKVINFILH